MPAIAAPVVRGREAVGVVGITRLRRRLTPKRMRLLAPSSRRRLNSAGSAAHPRCSAGLNAANLEQAGLALDEPRVRAPEGNPAPPRSLVSYRPAARRSAKLSPVQTSAPARSRLGYASERLGSTMPG